jgi:hypothetical protein
MTRAIIFCLVILAGCFSTTDTAKSGKDDNSDVADDQGAKADPVPFDGKRAMKYLEAICDIGPRQSGTPGMRKQIELITKHFEDLGFKVEVQAFSAKQKSKKNAVDMKNLIIRFFPDNDRRVMLCSHYDTRPIADQEPDPKKWRETFVSANDGGSGVAFLMEMANHMKNLKTNVGVDFVLFDGEEFVFDRNDEYFLGSDHFANEYKKSKAKAKYVAAVLLDMIAGKSVRFPIEGNSWFKAKAVCKQIWGIAAQLKVDMFIQKVGDDFQDDHIALHKADIPAIDIIPPLTKDCAFGEFCYPHWHRLTDVPANCSVESFENVAKVLSVWLQTVK